MITKIFKSLRVGSALTLVLCLTGCLHNPEIPFVRPNELSKQDTQNLEKSASLIFSDLIFESPLGERSFSSVKFDYDPKDKHLETLAGVIKRLIRKDSTIFEVVDSLNNQTFTIKLATTVLGNTETVALKLIENKTKKSIYTKGYSLKLK